jgi:putative ABC transport system permease protein
MLHDLWIRLRSLLRRETVEWEMEDELRFHAERQLEKYLKEGLSRDEAARRVRITFGGTEQVKEDCRDARGVSLFEDLMQDFGYGWRTLLKSPGFAWTALLTIASGIGANAFEDWRAGSCTLSEMAAVVPTAFDLAGIGQPEYIRGLAVSPEFLSMTDVQPILGRRFTSSEAKAGASPVLLLSYSLWQSHFGADRNVTGKTVRLDSRDFTIVGVLPPNFRWSEKCTKWNRSAFG